MRSTQWHLERAFALQRRCVIKSLGLSLAMVPLAAAIAGPMDSAPSSRWFTTSDGVRLHYLEAGAALRDSGTPTIAFVPGWTMPAWIWQAQIEYLAPRFRALALDPRGQGDSAIAETGYDYARRAADITEWLAAAGVGQNVVLVGWSLGVLESLQFMHDARQAGVAAPVRALVLVDNSVGVGTPGAGNPTFFARLRAKRRETVTRFVRSMFKRAPDPRWLDDLVDAALRTPVQASIDLLRQARPRDFWREALYATQQPVLYAYTPRFAQQGEIAKAGLPGLETRLFAGAGHALFVDEAASFNQVLERFIERATHSAGPMGRPR